MKDISKLSIVLNFKLKKELIPKLQNAQRKTAEKIWEDTIDSSPFKNGDYISSIQIGKTENNKGVIKTSVFSDLKVGGDIPKWQNVLLANFINWGTGPLGEATNDYPHGYSYTTDFPWNYQTQIQYQLYGTWGMEANPHFYNSLQKNVSTYKENLRKCFK